MAKAAKTAWGIDVGNCKLKALKLGMGDGGAEVLDFVVIEHEKILSQPDVTPEERMELTTKALNQFIEENDVKNSAVVVSVPGQNSFARFIKLPPVEKKRIPEIVRYEAIQQIPFEIDEVEWDWQAFQSDEAADLEVGIFAIRRDLVSNALAPFTQTDCLVNLVQMAPMALFNFLQYDQKLIQETAGNQAIVTLDIGAENSDLVIADGSRVWQRSIPIGGNQFTTAVQKAFKLSFAKAEAIKRTASTSKYARQIFQAMRSVFADLAAEVQRSLGFYSSSNRDVQFREVLALGNAMKLPGLVKFLQQSLSMPVKRLDNFESLKLSPDISTANFASHIPALGVAYGLALQGIGQGVINSNLLPKEVVRQTQLHRKRPYFVAATAIILISGLLCFVQALAQKKDIEKADSEYVSEITRVGSQINKNSSGKSTAQGKINSAKSEIGKYTDLYQSRNLVPLLFQTVTRDCVPNENNNPDQKQLYKAFSESDLETLMKVPRRQREQVFIHSARIVYTEDLSQDFDTILQDKISKRSSSKGRMPGDGMMPGGAMMLERFGPGGARGMPMPSPGGRRRSRSRSGTDSIAIAKKEPGFVVVIVGTTPHQEGRKFLALSEMNLDRSQWRFFDRLRYLGMKDEDIVNMNQNRSEEKSNTSKAKTSKFSIRRKKKNKKTVPPKSAKPVAKKMAIKSPQTPAQKAASDQAGKLPFVRYVGDGSTNSDFDISRGGWLDGGLPLDQPQGIGILEEVESDERSSDSFGGIAPRRTRSGSGRMNPPPLYIDPMTSEPISITYKKNINGEVEIDTEGHPIVEYHDYWFKMQFKVKWKEAPKAKTSGSKTSKSTKKTKTSKRPWE